MCVCVCVCVCVVCTYVLQIVLSLQGKIHLQFSIDDDDLQCITVW